MGKLHDDEVETDASLVRRLVRRSFPQWGDLPISRLASGGTVNAVYRLGSLLTVRLPLTEGGTKDLEKESRWLPALAPLLPVTIPTVAGIGAPGEGYPWPWSVHRWIEGTNPVEGRVVAPTQLARDLAAFVRAMRKADIAGGPPAYRGGPLSKVDTATREAITQLGETFDLAALDTVWQECVSADPWTGPPVWLHSDLMPSNLLVRDAKLAAVIDFSTAGVGDPACDLIPAWGLLPAQAREIFRAEADVDDATWTRGRGWALSMAAIQLPYYRTTNPVISANARHVLHEVLAQGSLRDR